jgi:hypothetical protein
MILWPMIWSSRNVSYKMISNLELLLDQTMEAHANTMQD